MNVLLDIIAVFSVLGLCALFIERASLPKDLLNGG